MITRSPDTATILARLRAKVERRLPITIASAGGGLVAKLLEEQGVDCINTFSGARLRANGMGTMSMMWPILDSNRQTLDYTREDIMPALAGKAFVCACLNANDPLKDMRVVLDDCRRMGVNAVSNIGPSISYVDRDSEIYRVLTSAGITLDNEIDMLRLAREETDMVAIGLAFTREDALRVVEEARPHVFCYHAGTTRGGRTGYDDGRSIADTAAATEEVYRALREIDPDVILVGHGAAMESPEDAQYMLDNTSGHGFWTGSSTERLPIERAVTAAAAEFTALRFGGGGTREGSEPAGGEVDGGANRRIAVLATMDTKGAECGFLRDEIARLGARATLVDIGVVDDPPFAVDHDAASVARRGGTELAALRDKPSRERASEVMVRGATALLEELLAAGEVDAVLSLGGTQGTANGCRVMGALPYGLPKIMLSTMASGDVSGYVGIKDITMMFSVADILGLNPFFRRVLANAAGAAVGMANASRDFAFATDRPVVGITNLGVLTRGTMRAMELLAERGHETIVFHAVGSGGRAMEQLMREGRIGAVLDFALGDLADALFGGIRAADESRLTVAAELGLPQVVAPGGTDHLGILLDEPNVVPERWQARPHTFHNPSILVPRPTADELGQLAEEIGRRLAGAGSNTVFLAPRKGLSSYSVPGGPLADEAGDAAFIRALQAALPEAVRFESVDAGAEDEAFVRRAVDELVALIDRADGKVRPPPP